MDHRRSGQARHHRLTTRPACLYLPYLSYLSYLPYPSYLPYLPYPPYPSYLRYPPHLPYQTHPTPYNREE